MFVYPSGGYTELFILSPLYTTVAMHATIICYDLVSPGLSGRAKARLDRELYGWTDRSNNARYTYERDGLLTRVPHLRPVRSVLVVASGHAGEVIGLLERHGAQVFVREVVLTPEDVKRLGGRSSDVVRPSVVQGGGR